MTTNDYKRLWAKLGMTITAIGNKHRHKNVYYDYTTTNVVNALKSVLKIVVLHFWGKLWKSTCETEAVVRRCSAKVSVLKNFADFTGTCIRVSFKQSCRPSQFYWKRLQYRRFPMKFANFLRTPFYRTPPVAASGNKSSIVSNVTSYIFYLKNRTSFTRDFWATGGV